MGRDNLGSRYTEQFVQKAELERAAMFVHQPRTAVSQEYPAAFDILAQGRGLAAREGRRRG